MDETDTKITVSSINEISSFNMERVITIRGGLEEMSKAEAEISSKLRSAYESDVQAMVVSRDCVS
jgi:insulin-like growth factor 2 mRNA-binding protein 1